MVRGRAGRVAVDDLEGLGVDDGDVAAQLVRHVDARRDVGHRRIDRPGRRRPDIDRRTTLRGGLPVRVACGELLAADQPEQHLGRRVGELRVQLEARPLEVLHRVGLAVGLADLGELVADRVAVLRQPAGALPVGPERAPDAAIRLDKAGVAIAGRIRRRSPLRVARRELRSPQRAEQDHKGRVNKLLVILEARPLEILDPVGLPAHRIGLIELIGDRIPLPLQRTMPQPVGIQEPPHALAGLREALLRQRRARHSGSR